MIFFLFLSNIWLGAAGKRRVKDMIAAAAAKRQGLSILGKMQNRPR